MKSLSSLLNKRKNINKISLTDKDIFYIFDRVIKEEFGNVGASKIKADYFKNKTIFIKCYSSAWASELFSNRNMIMKKLNKEFGEGIIREIKFK